MRYWHTVMGNREAHTWESKPERRSDNGGLGACNTSSGKHFICALGGIGCDVDHVLIARDNLATLRGPEKPKDGS